MTVRYYVGVNKGVRKVFRSSHIPTAASHGRLYAAVIGPFRTKGGADVMAKYGGNNPHLQTVTEAEKMAKQLKAGKR